MLSHGTMRAIRRSRDMPTNTTFLSHWSISTDNSGICQREWVMWRVEVWMGRWVDSGALYAVRSGARSVAGRLKAEGKRVRVVGGELPKAETSVRAGPGGTVLRCKHCRVISVMMPGDGVHDEDHGRRPRGMSFAQWWDLEHAACAPKRTTIRLGTLEMIEAERRAMPRKRSADGTEDIWKDGW